MKHSFSCLIYYVHHLVDTKLFNVHFYKTSKCKTVNYYIFLAIFVVAPRKKGGSVLVATQTSLIFLDLEVSNCDHLITNLTFIILLENKVMLSRNYECVPLLFSY